MGRGGGGGGGGGSSPPIICDSCYNHINWFIASYMLYVHSSKAEEFDLKTIARNFIQSIPADLIILANCDGVIFLT